MKIKDIIMERLPKNDDEEVKGKGDKYKSSHPFIDDKVAVFHGPNSASWNPEMVDLARKLEKRGQDRQSIWKATGVFRNSNGDWRMEISDYGMQIKTIPKVGQTLKLGDVIDHPELFKAYPRLKNMPVRGYGDEDAHADALGYYDPGKFNIAMKIPGDYWGPEEWRRTMAHELQHVIQGIEKPGSLKLQGDDEAWKAALSKAGVDVSDYELYQSWWKEVDARLVGDRLDMKPDFNKIFAPTSRDTKYWQVDDTDNRTPGTRVTTHPSQYPDWVPDSVTIPNPFYKDNMNPFQNDPDYKHGNNQGAVDQSNKGHNQLKSPYRNQKRDISVKPKLRPDNLKTNTNNNKNVPKEPKTTPPASNKKDSPQ